LVVVVGAAVYDRSVPRTVAVGDNAGSSLLATSAVPPAGAESSSWYCTGGTGSQSSLGTPTVYLTNTSDRAVSGTVQVVSDAGKTGGEPVTVPANSQIAVSPDALAPGSWVATSIDLDGGGVVATQSVVGSTGWAEAPCTTGTSPTWYFASGATGGGKDLFISVFNPTATLAVVNLGFTGLSGEVQRPPPFEGVVVPPGGVSVADVGSYVQDQTSLSTSVVTTSGRVVADALEIATGPQSGTSLRLGAPQPLASWTVPRTVNVTGGDSTLDIYNPTSDTEAVTVSFRLATGAPAPFVGSVPPGATWSIRLDQETRLPHNDDFRTSVVASGGPGVVVDRIMSAPAVATPPQWGAAPAVDVGLWSGGARTWVLPAPGVPGQPAVKGAVPFAVSVANQSAGPVTAHFAVLGSSGAEPLGGPVLIAPGSFEVAEATVVARAGLAPLLVMANGPVAVSEDLVPAGAPGVVSMPGLPVG
jgi:hypothetical protein